ncbi:UNVERIFIED_ORG: hypothetical protein Xoosp15_143 [Xanthomonas phage Xoo-sp15]
MKDIQDDIAWDTKWSKRYYENRKKEIEDYEKDENKEYRVNKNTCRTCLYLRNGASLQAFTGYTCKFCKEECMHPNSRTPKYCSDCAKELNVCKNCGSEMD